MKQICILIFLISKKFLLRFWGGYVIGSLYIIKLLVSKKLIFIYKFILISYFYINRMFVREQNVSWLVNFK